MGRFLCKSMPSFFCTMVNVYLMLQKSFIFFPTVTICVLMVNTREVGTQYPCHLSLLSMSVYCNCFYRYIVVSCHDIN